VRGRGIFIYRLFYLCNKLLKIVCDFLGMPLPNQLENTHSALKPFKMTKNYSQRRFLFLAEKNLTLTSTFSEGSYG